MTHVVQFTKWIDFIADVAAGETGGIYHELIEQRTAGNQAGYSRWLLTTIVRAFVANGSQTHVAALTIPHGRQVARLNGGTIGGVGETDEARWARASERHETIIDDLARLLHIAGVPMELIRGGIVNVPADLPFVLASVPLDEDEDTPRAADLEALWAARLQAADAAADEAKGE